MHSFNLFDANDSVNLVCIVRIMLVFGITTVIIKIIIRSAFELLLLIAFDNNSSSC